MFQQVNHPARIAFNVPEESLPCITRTLLGRTRRDAEVDEMLLPVRPWGVLIGVLSLRLYRRVRPTSVGNRCVCDPSCSRYAELAIRQRGLSRGVFAAILRL